jgi:hypothetical protein
VVGLPEECVSLWPPVAEWFGVSAMPFHPGRTPRKDRSES